MSALTWELRHFTEPTPYLDSPDELIAPGYYFVGYPMGGDPQESPQLLFKLEESVDVHGQDNHDAIAAYVLSILNAAPEFVH